MSKKNLDEHGRLRSKTVAFRVSPEEGMQMVYLELLRLGEGDEVQPELLDVIRLLAALFEGFGGGGAPTAHCSPRDALLHMERGD